MAGTGLRVLKERNRAVTQHWIGGALWDCFWILSGVPIGLALVALSPTFYLTLAVIVLLEHAHFLSPIALAWSHAGFRQIIRRQPAKYLGIPIAVVAATTAIGIATSLFAS